MASTPTTRYGYSKPATGDVAWDSTTNNNWDLLDADLWAEHNADGTHKLVTFSGNADLNGNNLIIDTDGDSYLHESADDVVDLVLAGASGEFGITINAAEDFTFTANSFNVLAGSVITMSGNLDLNGQDLLLDADGDSYLHESADDVVDLILAGATGELAININAAEDFTFTANALNVLAGSSIVMADGATIGQVAGPLLTFGDTGDDLEITGCNVGIGCDPQEALDIVGTALRGQNVLTDSNTKSFRMVVGHYDNTEEALIAFLGTSTVSAGNIYFGGGSGVYNAATLTRFYAAADNVTLTGTEIMRYDISGLGIGTLASSDRLLHAEVADAVTNAVTYAQRLGHITSGTAAAGFGTGLEFELEGADATFLVTGAIENVLTDAGTGAEDADMVFKVSTGGATAAEVLRMKSDNNVVITGNFNPEADGTRSLGTQTTAQWANVWSDLINGSDYSYLNGWRTLEAEKYAGYPAGLAIGNEGFVNGQVTERMANGLRPLFAVTEEFIEYAGVRITPEQWARLAQLAQ